MGPPHLGYFAIFMVIFTFGSGSTVNGSFATKRNSPIGIASSASTRAFVQTIGSCGWDVLNIVCMSV